MWPFGPKAPCSHCGKNVRKPKDPGKYLCPHCGEPGPWAAPEQSRAWESARDARAHYADLLKQLVSGGSPTALAPALKETAAQTWYTGLELQRLALREINDFAQTALADKVLTDEEDHRLGELVPVLGLTWESILTTYPALGDRLVIASANAGRLPTVVDAQLLLKNDEVVHAQYAASLMKEVTLREWRSGSQGVSIPLGKGFRYRVGTTRGHSVVVGTQMQVADTGTLYVTSQRAVFTGSRKTMEFQYKKLANLAVFTDGVQFNVTNRQTASLFTVRNGEVVAAIVNAAVQRMQ